MDKYKINRDKMDIYQKRVKGKQTELERIVWDLLKEEGFKFTFKKGFLKATSSFCVVDFYLSRPYRAGIQIVENKENRFEQAVFSIRKFNLLYLGVEDFHDLIKLKDKIKVFLSNSKHQYSTPWKKRKVLIGR